MTERETVARGLRALAANLETPRDLVEEALAICERLAEANSRFEREGAALLARMAAPAPPPKAPNGATVEVDGSRWKKIRHNTWVNEDEIERGVYAVANPDWFEAYWRKGIGVAGGIESGEQRP